MGWKRNKKKWFFCDYHLEDLKRTTSAKNCLCQATFFRIVININACIKINLVNRVDRSKCQPLRGKFRNKMKFQHILWKWHGYIGKIQMAVLARWIDQFQRGLEKEFEEFFISVLIGMRHSKLKFHFSRDFVKGILKYTSIYRRISNKI